MPSGTVNWGDVATWERLLASVLATGIKIDLKEVARYYGTTYNTLENRLRKVKEHAKALKDEPGVADYDISSAVPVGRGSAATTPRKPRTPKKSQQPLESITNGRVTKKTPSKKGSSQVTAAVVDGYPFGLPTMGNADDGDVEPADQQATPYYVDEQQQPFGFGMDFSL